MAALRLSFLVLLAAVSTVATAAKAPAPAAAPSVNLTGILDKAGQYSTFINFLDSTGVGNQVNNQLNEVSPNAPGMTVFAPTDNAFANVKKGLLNSLSVQDQVKFVLFYVLPKYYSLTDFQTVSNPVQTQASTDDGKQLGLTIDYLGVNSVNVSTGKNETTVNNAVSSKFPLAVYQLDEVLLPEALFGAKAPKSAPVSSSPAKSKGKAEGPSAPATADTAKNAAYGVTNNMGFSFVAVVGFFAMGFLL